MFFETNFPFKTKTIISFSKRSKKCGAKEKTCFSKWVFKSLYTLSKVILLFSFFTSGAYAIDDETIEYKTFQAGALVIDMGISPQTVGNALQPYGYLTNLFANDIPVEWVIKPGKAKDSIDFTVDGKNFSGGPFVIKAGFAPQAKALLASWPTVVSYTTLTEATNVPVYETLRLTPFTVLDAANGSISQAYLDAAGVPSSFYGFKDPESLNQCDDFYSMPHADPEWSTHSNLIPWNQQGGYIWAACHAVSVMEAVDDPDDADTDPDMNFLSVNGLVDFGDHGDGTPPYQYSPVYQSDPQMQFLGVGDIQNGSEQIYLPTVDGWRPSTRIAVFDDDHPETSTINLLEEAAFMAYGRAFGDPSRGQVMYEGGHTHVGTGPNEVAAQRAFLNFWLKAGIDRGQVIVIERGFTSPTMPSNSTDTFTVISTGGSGVNSYEWVSTCGGIFSNPTSVTTNFTAPVTTVDLVCNIGVRVTDSCGRTTPVLETTTILGLPNLKIEKTDSQDPVPVGGNFTYTINVQNNGSNATGVIVTDTLPGDVTYVSDTGSCTGVTVGSTGILSCIIGDLAKDASTSFTVTVTAPATAPLTITNNASVVANEGDLDTADNTTSEPTLILAEIDLEMLSKTVSPVSGGIGDTFTFTLSVKNNGAPNATSVVVEDVLLSELGFVSASGAGWGCFESAGTVTCLYNNILLNGAIAPVLTIVTTALSASSTTLANSASVSTLDFADSNINNNTQIANFNINAAADLRMDKIVDAPGAGNGLDVEFRLLLSNEGPDTVTDAVIIDSFPFSDDRNVTNGFKDYLNDKGGASVDELNKDFSIIFPGSVTPIAFTKGDPLPQTITDASTGLSFRLEFVPADYPPSPLGTTQTIKWTQVAGNWTSGQDIQVIYKLKTEYDEVNPLVNGANVSSMQIPDPFSSNNSDSVSILKNIKGADLEIIKTGPAGPIDLGTDFTYLISVLNNGPENLVKTSLPDQNIVTIVDTLPAGMTFVSASTTGNVINDYDGGDTTDNWSCSGTTTVTCAFEMTSNNFNNGKYLHNLNITVNSTTNGTKLNSASVSYIDNVKGYIDIQQSNNIDSHSLITGSGDPLPADIKIVKTVVNQYITDGGIVDFTLNISNNGLGNVIDALITDDFTYSSDSSGGNASGFNSYLNNIDQLSNTMTVVFPGGGTATIPKDATDTINHKWVVEDPNFPAIGLQYELSFDPAYTTTNGTPQKIKWQQTRGILEPFESVQISYKLKAEYDQPESDASSTNNYAINSVKVASVSDLDNTSNSDPNFGNNTDSVIVKKPVVDLEITKTGPTSPVEFGNNFSYVVSVKNNGPENLPSGSIVKVTDVLPAGLILAATPTSGTNGKLIGNWVCLAPVGNSFDCTLTTTGTLNINEILNDLLITVTPTTDGNLSNFATVSYSNSAEFADIDPTDDTDTATVTVFYPPIDVEITKVVDNASPNLNDNVTFTISFTNHGAIKGADDGNSATGVVVNDPLPAGLTLISATASQGAYTSGAWYVGDVNDIDSAAGATVTLTIVAKVDSLSAMINTATLGNVDQLLKDTADDTDAVTITPQSADLVLTKDMITPLPIAYNGNATFRVTLTNNGPQDATNVVVTDILPYELVVITPATDIVPSAGTTAVQNVDNTITWIIPSITNGSTITLDVIVKVVSADLVTNTATIGSADQADPDVGNNTTSTATVDAVAVNIGLQKTVALTTDNAPLSVSGNPDLGDVITYTVIATNLGPDDAVNINIQETMPSLGLDAGSIVITPSVGTSYDTGSNIWTIPSLANGASTTLTISGTVNAVGNVLNTVSLLSVEQVDTNINDNVATSTALAGGVADLYIQKTVNNTTPLEGDNVVFSIQVDNYGPDNASGVVITDTLPAGLTYVSDDGGVSTTVSGGVITWSLGIINNATTATLNVTANVNALTVGQSLTNNVAIIGSDQADPDNIGNSASATVVTQSLPVDLKIVKAINDATPNIGDIVIFTLLVENLGPGTATVVTVNDILPAGFSYVAASITGGDASNDSSPASTGLTWTINSLTAAPTAGSSTTLTFQAVVQAP